MKLRLASMAVLGLFALNINATATPTAFNYLANEVLRAGSDSQVVLLGENGHGYPEGVSLLTEVLRKDAVQSPEHFDYIGIELGSDLQEYLDRVVNDPSPARLKAFFEITGYSRDFEETQLAYQRFFETVHQLNRSRAHRGFEPLKVLAMDMSSEEAADMISWFKQRDSHMFGQLEIVSEKFQKRGVVLAGAGHTFKVPFPLPAYFRSMIGIEGDIQTLGTMLSKKLGSDRVTSVWVDLPITPSQRFANLPPELSRHFKWIANWRAQRPFSVPTTNESFSTFERVANKSHPSVTALPLSRGADLVIAPPSQLKSWTKCESLFSISTWRQGFSIRARKN